MTNNLFQDHIYFEDAEENKAFIVYVYKRNSQLYAVLDKGMSYQEAREIFGLTVEAIRTRYKTFRHKRDARRQAEDQQSLFSQEGNV